MSDNSKRKTKRVTFRLERDLHAELRRLAKAERVKLSTVVHRAVAKFIAAA